MATIIVLAIASLMTASLLLAVVAQGQADYD